MTRIVIALCIGLAARSAAADGMFIPSAGVTTGVAETTHQRALLVFESGHTTLALQTGYRGNGTAFSWVVPTPELVEAGDVFTAPAALFDELHEATAPRLVSFTRGCGVAGCAGEDAETSGQNTVTVFDAFHVDGYAISVLGATESADLAGWLTSTGHQVPPGADTVFADYIARDYFFVAVRFDGPVSSESPGGGDPGPAGDAGPVGGPGEPPPLAIRFNGTVETFPMLISTVSTTDQADVLLYTAAAQRYTATNYETRDMEIDEVFERGDFDAWYSDQLDARLDGDAVFVVEHAAELYLSTIPAVDEDTGYWFVTRLHTRLRPDQMVRDVMLGPAASNDVLKVRIMHGGKAQAAAAVIPWDVALLLGLALVIHLRRRVAS